MFIMFYSATVRASAAHSKLYLYPPMFDNLFLTTFVPVLSTHKMQIISYVNIVYTDPSQAPTYNASFQIVLIVFLLFSMIVHNFTYNTNIHFPLFLSISLSLSLSSSTQHFM